MTWLVVALVAIALIAIGAYLMDKQRSAALRRRFGPEYERALDDAGGDRRAAESRLRDQLKRRAAVEVRDLDDSGRARYAARWRAVQVAFVDDPAGSVREAEALVEELVDERGYGAAGSGAAGPEGDGDRDGVDGRYEMLAVDHPDLVERHRLAREAGASGSVDDLREAFLHHKALFRALVGEEADGGRRDPRPHVNGRPLEGDAPVVRS